MGPVVLGLDIGQKRDPTALAVAEVRERRTGRVVANDHEMEDVFRLRFIAALPLGTPYPTVAERVVDKVEEIATAAREEGRDLERDEPAEPNISLRIDATGVGAPVIDLIRQSLRDASVRVNLSEVTFAAGQELHGSWGSEHMRLGKAFMVSRLQALLQTDRIKAPDTAEVRALVRELQNYELRVNDKATLQAGAFRVGTHDDLATALGLATLLDYRSGRVTVGPAAEFEVLWS